MARLPEPGGDAGTWSSILNEYLLVSHNADGTQRTDSIGSSALQSRAVGIRHLRTLNATGTPISNLVLSNNGSELVWKSAGDVALPPSASLTINVADYGAIGDGVTDDTEAIQRAINAARNGGRVDFPKGTFMVRQLKIVNKGTALQGAARFGTRIVRISGSAPLIEMNGTGTMAGHLRYCSIINIMLDGASLPGPLVRSVYSDNFIFRDVNFINCAGTAVDLTEVWDTRFESCAWEHCGSTTEPATWLRNTQPQGTFGYSLDNTNQIHFISCRWEGFKNGALRLDGALNGSTAKLNGIFIVACKMESSVLAGPAFQIGLGSTVVYVSQLYMAMMAFDAGYNTPIDAIDDSGTQVFMTNVYVQWGPARGLANSTVHVARSTPHMYHEISTFYPTEDPARATIAVEMEASDVMVSCLWLNRGLDVDGMVMSMLESSPDMGLNVPLMAPGAFRVTQHHTDKDLIKVDANETRPALLFPNGVDAVGFSDAYGSEKWRLVSSNGAARFAGGKFQVEATKGHIGINATPMTNIAMLVRAGAEGDKGLAIVRPSNTATSRLMEFQDETYNIQGQAFDSNGRPLAVGTPARVTAGAQVSYANPGLQVRDIAGNIVAAVKASPTAAGVIATVTFSRPYAATPLSIMITDHSAVWSSLYVSARSATGFTVSTRVALQGGSLLNFDYSVIA